MAEVSRSLISPSISARSRNVGPSVSVKCGAIVSLSNFAFQVLSCAHFVAGLSIEFSLVSSSTSLQTFHMLVRCVFAVLLPGDGDVLAGQHEGDAQMGLRDPLHLPRRESGE